MDAFETWGRPEFAAVYASCVIDTLAFENKGEWPLFYDDYIDQPGIYRFTIVPHVHEGGNTHPVVYAGKTQELGDRTCCYIDYERQNKHDKRIRQRLRTLVLKLGHTVTVEYLVSDNYKLLEAIYLRSYGKIIGRYPLENRQYETIDEDDLKDSDCPVWTLWKAHRF